MYRCIQGFSSHTKNQPEGRGQLISHHNVLNRITVDRPPCCGRTRMRFLVHYVGPGGARGTVLTLSV